jgi:transcriptional regulator with XRE-family HTH domain
MTMALRRTRGLDDERLLDQERLILHATEAVVGLLAEQTVTRQELAARLGKSKGFVSQLLSGERNMTLRTLADLGHVLGFRFSVRPVPAAAGVPMPSAAVEAARAAFSTEYERTTGEARRVIPARAVETLRDAAEKAVDSHEYALAA